MGKIHFRQALASLALGSLGVACGSDDSGSEVVTFSCRYSTNDKCFEFVGPAGPALEESRNLCLRLGGAGGTGCARNDVSGSCTFPQEASRSVFYGLDDDELTLVRQTCDDSNGVWSAS